MHKYYYMLECRKDVKLLELSMDNFVPYILSIDAKVFKFSHFMVHDRP